MKKRIYSLILSLLLCFSLSATALAAGGFDASVSIDRETAGQISVTVNADNSILSDKKPTLTIPCDFENADVLFDGQSIGGTVSNGQVSFTVAAKGTYVIVEVATLHTVTWSNGDGGSYEKDFSCGEAITLPTSEIFADTMRKRGYTLTDWVNEEGIKIGDPMPAKDVTFTAQYTVNWYTITFDTNGGSEIEPITQAYGTPVTLPEDPTRRGYDFLGWDIEIPETMPDENLTITAIWEEIVYEPYIPPTSTEVTENEDGSTTITVTNNRTGTVTETTENTDGSVTTVETKKNGTVTEIVESTDGSTVTTVTQKDGSSVTVAELADGTTATITTDTDGKTETEVVISEEAVLSGTTVALPIPAVERTNDSKTASAITVTTNSETEISVAIPVAEVSTSTVAVLVNEDGTETVITETKMTENGLVIDVPDGAVVKVVDNAISFTDVSDTDWEQAAVNFASARGLVNGVGNNSFDLDGIATRGQVMTLLARLAGVDTTPDEGQMWYDKGREWAMANGISDGTNVNQTIARDEMMTMLWRFMGSPESDHDIGHFTDAHELSPWTEEAARWAIEIGLVQGHGNGTMTPKALTTRGQLAQFMMNFIQLM